MYLWTKPLFKDYNDPQEPLYIFFYNLISFEFLSFIKKYLTRNGESRHNKNKVGTISYDVINCNTKEQRYFWQHN